MAATRKEVESTFNGLAAKLPGRGYFLEFTRNKVCMKQKADSGDKEISPWMTMTPFYHWLTVLIEGIKLAQTPLPTVQKCPICGGKLTVYEALPVERWTYLCSHCEETGTSTELQEIAKNNGE